MPLWPRGVRGLEFWSLLRLARAADCLARQIPQAAETIDRLAQTLRPITELGPRVIEVQAAQRQNRNVSAEDEALQRRWFPAPRRVGGEMASALAALERALFFLIRRQQAAIDNALGRW